MELEELNEDDFSVTFGTGVSFLEGCCCSSGRVQQDLSRHRTHYDRFFICSFLRWSPSNNRRCLPCVFCIARTRSTCIAAPPQFVATPLLARVNAQGSYCSANARAACWDEHQVCGVCNFLRTSTAGFLYFFRCTFSYGVRFVSCRL